MNSDSPLITNLRTLPVNVRLIDTREDPPTNTVVDRRTVEQAVRESGLDLICINRPQDGPWVCKLLDYSKFLFNKKKEEKQKQRIQRQNDRTPKEMQFRQQISEHDYAHKVEQILTWLPKHDVWIELKLDRKSRPGLPRGVDFRQLPRWKDFVLNRVVRDLEGKAQVSPPQIGERIIKMIVRPL